MIFTLNILINLCLIYAIWRTHRKPKRVVFPEVIRTHNRLSHAHQGRLERAEQRARVAEKMAERAFNLASTANLGVVALQKSLAVPRLLSNTQAKQNALAKKEVDRLFTKEGGLDWLKPILSDEELDIIEKAEEHHEKFNGATK